MNDNISQFKSNWTCRALYSSEYQQLQSCMSTGHNVINNDEIFVVLVFLMGSVQQNEAQTWQMKTRYCLHNLKGRCWNLEIKMPHQNLECRQYRHYCIKSSLLIPHRPIKGSCSLWELWNFFFCLCLFKNIPLHFVFIQALLIIAHGKLEWMARVWNGGCRLHLVGAGGLREVFTIVWQTGRFQYSS